MKNSVKMTIVYIKGAQSFGGTGRSVKAGRTISARPELEKGFLQDLVQNFSASSFRNHSQAQNRLL